MISEFFVDRPIFANVIAFVTIIIGLVALYELPVAQYPQIVPPTIQVTTRYPGASAQVVAETIGVPIEQAVNGVEGSIYMSSVSGSDGSYTLTITFDVGTNLNTSLALVQNLVNSSLAQLPGGAQLQGVTVKKVSPNILLVVSLYSDDDRFDEIFLSNYASHKPSESARPYPGRRPGESFRLRALQHESVAGSKQAPIVRNYNRRRAHRHPGAKRPGHLGSAWRASRTPGATLPIYDQHAWPSFRRRPV